MYTRNEYAKKRTKEPRYKPGVLGRKLGTLFGLDVYDVNGTRLRKKDCYSDFTMGGNCAVYPFIKTKHIVVDQDMNQTDKAGTTIHEYVERQHMLEGKSYSDAHDIANQVEGVFRDETSKVRKINFKKLERLITKYKQEGLW